MEFVDAAVIRVKQSTHLFAVKTLGLSIGQICEMQTARDNDIPIIFAEHADAATEKSYLRDFAQHSFLWGTEGELAAGIRALV